MCRTGGQGRNEFWGTHLGEDPDCLGLIHPSSPSVKVPRHMQDPLLREDPVWESASSGWEDLPAGPACLVQSACLTPLLPPPSGPDYHHPSSRSHPPPVSSLSPQPSMAPTSLRLKAQSSLQPTGPCTTCLSPPCLLLLPLSPSFPLLQPHSLLAAQTWSSSCPRAFAHVLRFHVIISQLRTEE
jgi:hypothetical protein